MSNLSKVSKISQIWTDDNDTLRWEPAYPKKGTPEKLFQKFEKIPHTKFNKKRLILSSTRSLKFSGPFKKDSCRTRITETNRLSTYVFMLEKAQHPDFSVHTLAGYDVLENVRHFLQSYPFTSSRISNSPKHEKLSYIQTKNVLEVLKYSNTILRFLLSIEKFTKKSYLPSR